MKLFTPLLLPLLVLTGCLTGCLAQETSRIPTPLARQTQLVPLDRPVLDGPFTLDARLTLHTLGGTAASVKFGPRLNFGFDAKAGSLFVEGPAVGPRPIMLLQQKRLLRKDAPFNFRAERDDTGTLRLFIGDRPVFQSALPGKLGPIAFRPHRSTVTIHRAELTGNLGPIPPPVIADAPNIPLLIDGSPIHLGDIHLRLDAAVTFDAIDLDASPEFSSLGVEGLASGTRLGAGQHRLRLIGSIRPDAVLTNRPHWNLTSLTVTQEPSGTTTNLLADAFANAPLRRTYRLAVPLHKRGQFNCHTTRIPAIARATNGTLLAVFDLRYTSRRDLQGHMDIGLCRSTDGGQRWSPPKPIMDMGTYNSLPREQNGCSDPNILVDRETGEIFVAAVWTHGKPGTHQWVGKGSEPGLGIHQSTQFLVVRSRDNGRTWSPPENWTPQLKNPAWHLFAPAPGNGIQLANGTLIMPTQGRDETGRPFSNLMWSRDHGATWTVSAPARDNTTECAVTSLSDGRLLLNMRDNRNRADKSDTNGRALATTADLGTTWDLHPADHTLIEPVCMASMIAHRNVLIFSNPHHKTARTDMTIQFSADDGLTWPREHHIHLDALGGAYSSLVMIDDHHLGILYESSQADLLFQKIPLPSALFSRQ